jgi:hypothetical protein
MPPRDEKSNRPHDAGPREPERRTPRADPDTGSATDPEVDAWAAAFAAGGVVLQRHRVTRTPLAVGSDTLEGEPSAGAVVYRDPWRHYRRLGDPPITGGATSGYPPSVWLARDEYPADAPPEAIPPDTPPPRPLIGDPVAAAQSALARYDELVRVLRAALDRADGGGAGESDPLADALVAVGVGAPSAATLARHVRRMTKDETSALAWLLDATPPDLAGATPLEVARSGDLLRVHRVLHDMEHPARHPADILEQANRGTLAADERDPTGGRE